MEHRTVCFDNAASHIFNNPYENKAPGLTPCDLRTRGEQELVHKEIVFTLEHDENVGLADSERTAWDGPGVGRQTDCCIALAGSQKDAIQPCRVAWWASVRREGGFEGGDTPPANPYCTVKLTAVS
jgi:hypothetical protein